MIGGVRELKKIDFSLVYTANGIRGEFGNLMYRIGFLGG